MGCLELFLHWDTRAQSLSQRIYGSEKLRLLESGPLQERFTDPLLQDNSCMFFLKRSESEGGRKAARSSRADSVTTETPISPYSWCCALPRSPFYLHGPALVLPFPSQALFSWFTSVSGETAPIFWFNRLYCVLLHHLPGFWWTRPLSEVKMLQESNTWWGSVLCLTSLNKVVPSYLGKKVEKVYCLVQSALRTEIQTHRRLIGVNELLSAH